MQKYKESIYIYSLQNIYLKYVLQHFGLIQRITTYSHLLEQGNLKKQRCIILQTSESRVNCEYNRG